MSTKIGNPNFIKVGGHYYHLDLIFPTKGYHSKTEWNLDDEFVEHDFFAEHGMYAVSPLYALTGEPECPLIGAHAQNCCVWTEDPLDILIALEEADGCDNVHLCDAEFFTTEDLHEVDGDVLPDEVVLRLEEECLHSLDCERMHNRLHRKVTYGPDGEQVVKYSAVESHGVHGRKPPRPERITIRRADVIFGQFDSDVTLLVAKLRKT